MQFHLSFTRRRFEFVIRTGSFWKRFQKWSVVKTIRFHWSCKRRNRIDLKTVWREIGWLANCRFDWKPLAGKVSRKSFRGFRETGPGLEPRLLDSETSTKTMRPPVLPHYVSPKLLFHLFTFHTFKHQFCSFHAPRHSHFLEKESSQSFSRNRY